MLRVSALLSHTFEELSCAHVHKSQQHNNPPEPSEVKYCPVSSLHFSSFTAEEKSSHQIHTTNCGWGSLLIHSVFIMTWKLICLRGVVITCKVSSIAPAHVSFTLQYECGGGGTLQESLSVMVWEAVLAEVRLSDVLNLHRCSFLLNILKEACVVSAGRWTLGLLKVMGQLHKWQM